MSPEEFLGSVWTWLVDFFSQLGNVYFLPNLKLFIQVIVLLFVAYVAGRVCKTIVVKVLGVVGLRKMTVRSWTDDILRAMGYKGTIVHLIGDLVKWFIYLVFFGIIIETIGLPGLVSIFNQITGFVPKFIVSILVVVVGFLIADFLGKMFEEAGNRLAQDDSVGFFSGGIIKYSVALISVIMALSLIGLDTISLVVMLTIILSATIAILVIGLKDMIPNFTAGLHLRRVLKVGQTIKVRGYEGAVERVDPLTTTIKTGKSNVSIPNADIMKSPVEWKKAERK